MHASLQGGPEKILLETIDPFVVNSNFCEPLCIGKIFLEIKIRKVKITSPSRDRNKGLV